MLKYWQMEYESKMEIKIRTANPDDSNGLARLARNLEFFHELENEPFEVTQNRIAQHLAQCTRDENRAVIYVAVTPADQIVGYAAVYWHTYLFHTGAEGYLSELFLSAEARGQGIGSCLLECVEEEARRRGCRRLTLINMRQRESYQREFYKKHGWQERTEAANFVKSLV